MDAGQRCGEGAAEHRAVKDAADIDAAHGGGHRVVADRPPGAAEAGAREHGTGERDRQRGYARN